MSLEDTPFDQPQAYPVNELVRSSYFLASAKENVPIDVVRIPVSSRREANEYIAQHYELTAEPAVDKDTKRSQFANSITAYNDAMVENRESELREHQQNVFEDLAQFFNDDKDSGYVQLPTGTGKTVIFVELAKALLACEEEYHPKILVVTPTKDLVSQTIGEEGDKGFGRFASDVPVSSYFSDSDDTKGNTKQDKVKRSSVCVTTYASFSKMFTDNVESDFLFEYDESGAGTFDKPRKRKSFRPTTDEKVIDMFDVVIFDEAHHAHGQTIAEKLITLKGKGIPVVGFSATPGDEERNLEHIMGECIHSMSITEAIEQQLLAPIIPIGIKSKTRIDLKSYNTYTDQFLDDQLYDTLGNNKKRNDIIVNAAKLAVESGLSPVVSCLAGQEMLHPKKIAEMLNDTDIVDPKTGMVRKAKFSVIDSSIPLIERKQIYKKFEDGEIDGLTFINVLTEGWDSTKAKALINARPTRSRIFGQQRLGRVLRPSDEDQPALIIDIIDEVPDNMRINPLNTSDLLGEKPLRAGQPVASTMYDSAENLLTFSREFVEIFNDSDAELSSTLEPKYSAQVVEHKNRYKKTQSEIHVTVKRQGEEKAETKLFATVASIYEKGYIVGLDSHLLEKLKTKKGVDLLFVEKDSRVGVQKYYCIEELQNITRTLPEVNIQKYVVDKNGTKWVSTYALEKLLKTKIPHIELFDIEKAVEQLQESGGLDYEPPLVRFTTSLNPKTTEKQIGIAQLFKLEDYQKIAETYLLNR